MLSLNTLKSVTKKKKRVGRGGDRGGTSGKGHKGQRARSGVGGELKKWFEGGQMSLTRRLPRRGFVNQFKKNFKLLSLSDLENSFNSGDVVNKKSLYEKRLVSGKGKFLIKVLANGALSKKLEIQVDAFSAAAEKAIKDVGGKIEKVKEL